MAINWIDSLLITGAAFVARPKKGYEREIKCPSNPAVFYKEKIPIISHERLWRIDYKQCTFLRDAF